MQRSAVQCSTPWSIRSPDNPRFRFVNAYDDLIMETNEIKYNQIKVECFWGMYVDDTDVAPITA